MTGHYPSAGYNNTTQNGMAEWLNNKPSIGPFASLCEGFTAALGRPTTASGSSGGAAVAASASASASSARAGTAFPPGSSFINAVGVLPSGSIGKDGSLKGFSVKAQYDATRRLLQQAMEEQAARLYVTMGVQPAKAAHGAAAAAVAQGPQPLASSTRNVTRILRLTRVASALGTIIGAELGCRGEVNLGGLGMSSRSGAGAYLYAGGEKAVALVAVPHESSHGYQARECTGNFSCEGGTPISAAERERALLNKYRWIETLGAAGMAALLCELEGKVVDLEALREDLGRPVDWYTASQRGACVFHAPQPHCAANPCRCF